MSAEARDGGGRRSFADWVGEISGHIAVIGGILSLALALLVILSVAGRYFFSKPIEGDFEVVKMATAISVFSFLPYAQWRRSNIMVDTFTGVIQKGIGLAGQVSFFFESSVKGLAIRL